MLLIVLSAHYPVSMFTSWQMTNVLEWCLWAWLSHSTHQSADRYLFLGITLMIMNMKAMNMMRFSRRDLWDMHKNQVKIPRCSWSMYNYCLPKRWKCLVIELIVYLRKATTMCNHNVKDVSFIVYLCILRWDINDNAMT